MRERLLAAAEELFYAQGFASTGVDAVIERARVATGSLYKNFGGKDGLAEAYLRERDHRWRRHWEECVAEQDDPVERVLTLFTALERWSPGSPDNRGCAHLAAMVQLPRDHPGSQAAVRHKQHLSRRLEELCAGAGADDPAGLCRDLLLLYEGANNQVALGLTNDPVGRARRLARTLLEATPREAG